MREKLVLCYEGWNPVKLAHLQSQITPWRWPEGEELRPGGVLLFKIFQETLCRGSCSG
ncbi:hypothetical protein Peur_065434 [Populus x canadensis]